MSISPTSGPWSVERRTQRPFCEAMGAERYRQALQEEFRSPEVQAWLELNLGELLFDAYKEARINGRNSYAQVNFECDLGHNLAVLRRELLDGSYKPRRCIVFTVDRPVKREVIAPAFRDMVVGHLLCNYLSPIFERHFIADSYSCRKGKGTSYGINRLEHHIRSVTQNYTREGWVLQLDLRGFFMSIDQCILYDRVMHTLARGGHRADAMYPLAALLVRVTVFTDPTVGCHVRGKRNDWDGLPASKSLFNCPPGRGLPIGHLTSQLFSNVYLDPLDQFVKRELKAQHYGRYVDDFYFVTHSSREALALVEPIRVFLLKELHLKLHPRKIRLKRAVQGVQFLGVVVRPGRRILCHRAHVLMTDSLLVALTFFEDFHLIGARLRSFRGYLLDKCDRQLIAAVIHRIFFGEYLALSPNHSFSISNKTPGNPLSPSGFPFFPSSSPTFLPVIRRLFSRHPRLDRGSPPARQDLAPQPRDTRLGCCERSPSRTVRVRDGVLAAAKSGSCPANLPHPVFVFAWLSANSSYA